MDKQDDDKLLLSLDLQRSVIEAVLTGRPSLPPERRQQVNHTLDALARVPGFRLASAAPVRLLCPVVEKLARSRPRMAAMLTVTWAHQMTELRTRCIAVLASSKKGSGERTSRLRWADPELDDLAQQASKCSDGLEFEKAKLMLHELALDEYETGRSKGTPDSTGVECECCRERRLAAESSPCPNHPDPRSEATPASPESTRMEQVDSANPRTESKLGSALGALSEDLRAAAEGTRQCAAGLEMGRPPPLDLIQELRTLAERFKAACDQVTALGVNLSEDVTVDHLRTTLSALEAGGTEGERQAREVLAAIARLRASGRAVSGLDAVVDEAARVLANSRRGALVSGWTNEHQDWYSAAQALLALLDPATEPAAGEELRVRVERFFGRDLAWSALRGQLAVAPPEADTSRIAGVDPKDEARPEASTAVPLASQVRDPLPPEEPRVNSPVAAQVPIEPALDASEARQDTAQQTPTLEHIDAPVRDGGNHEAAPADGKTPEARKVQVGATAAKDLASLGLESPSELAKGVLGIAQDARQQAYQDLVWSLLGAGELALAYELARHCEGDTAPSNRGVPSSLIRALAFSTEVRSSEDAAALEVLSCIQETAVPPPGGDLSLGLRMVCVAMALRPALLARTSGADGFLKSIPKEGLGSHLVGLCDAVHEYSSLGLDLSPAILKGVREHAAWQEQLVSIQHECAAWLERARQQTILYAPATNTWRRLLDTGGALFNILQPVVDGKVDYRERVRTALAKLEDSREIDRIVVTADRDQRGKAATRKPIEDRAYRVLIQHFREALAYAERWLSQLSAVPAAMPDVRSKRVDQCRDRVLAALHASSKSLEPLSDGPRYRVATKVLERSLENIRQLFDPAYRQAQPRTVEQVLRAGLLRVPAVRLDSGWEPTGPSAEIALRITQAVAAGLDEWLAIFDANVAAENFAAAKRIVDVLELQAHLPQDLDKLRTRLEECLVASRALLGRQVAATLVAVEQAVSLDLLNEPERLEFMGIIEGIKPDEVCDLAPVREKLATIEARISQRRSERAGEIRARLEASAMQSKDELAYQRVVKALERHDFPTANEYLDAFQSGQVLPSTTPPTDPFCDLFFPKFIKEWFSWEASPPEVVKAIAAQKKLGPIDMGMVPRAQAVEASNFVNAWFRAKGKFDPAANVKVLFEGVGFRGVVLSLATKTDSLERYDLTAEPLRDRDTCVIPQFGSLARGRYRVVALWGRPSVEDLLNQAGSNASPPVVALFFGKMSESARRDLAKLCRERRRQVLVIDESLVMFLAMQRGSRLPVLFSCALPFTVSEPYVITAGLVPPEMFFGRARERDAIVDPLGTNLVYGGRQLGKTALLRDVERRFHDPAQGSVVRWIDLKEKGIGFNRPASDLWEVVAEVLDAEKIGPRRGSGFAAVRKRILEWLQEDQARRILLLIDESDHFLFADSDPGKGQPYPTVLQLKGLLEETEKRFKFVFAGLHDVQRTARDPNTPLAHLGTPICIGPLLGGGEPAEARSLIERPLATLGYRFESADLATRILSHTNYYPSLIQLFCWHLLDHVANARVTHFDPRGSPPYLITARHVDEAYQSQQLRKAIRDRFTWTLNLDARYRLIALLIALESIEDRTTLARGMSAEHIRESSLFWWTAGFERDDSLEAFKTILDEMIGLGVLRRNEANAYTLRSANILNLLGGKKDVEDQITDTINMVAPPPYEPANFRRAEPENPWRRSPLTTQQEALVFGSDNGACIVFGTKAACREEIAAFLGAARPGVRLVKLENLSVWNDLRNELMAVLEAREEYTLVYVDSSCAWSERWVEEAHLLARKRQAKASTVRVLFAGDGQAAWRWARLAAKQRARLLEDLSVETLSLGPWSDGAVRRWLDDAGFGPVMDEKGRQRILKVTGNWGALLHRLGEQCRGHGHRWEEQLSRLAPSKDEVLQLMEVTPETRPVLSLAIEYDCSASVDELVGVAIGIDEQLIRDAVGWARSLRLAVDRDDVVQLNPVLQAALAKS